MITNQIINSISKQSKDFLVTRTEIDVATHVDLIDKFYWQPNGETSFVVLAH